MDIVLGLIGVGLVAIFLVQALRIYAGALSHRMNLQDLRRHGKPHRAITEHERSSLASYAASLACLGNHAPSYRPLSDDVYLLQGAAEMRGFEFSGIHSEQLSIAGAPVELPFTLRDYLAHENNRAEVVVADRHALVLSLNGFRLPLLT